MFFIILRTIISALRSHRALTLENLALRHQLDVLTRNAKRPRLTNRDRTFWIILSQFWADWRKPLTFVQPETVVRWHKRGFRLYWKWKSQPRWAGRRRVPMEVRDLIFGMSRSNPLWGAPRIHGELLKLGIQVSQATVSKCIVRHHKPPSQSWRTFLKNHARDIISVDFFTVPTATFRGLFVFLVLNNERRKVVHFNVTESPIASWTGQQIVEAFPWDTAPGYLLRDRDGKFGEEFIRRVESITNAAPILDWRRTARSRDRLSHLSSDRSAQNQWLADCIIGISDELPNPQSPIGVVFSRGLFCPDSRQIRY